eukprot:TRINITY_DN41291_c0_g1_i1.p1 TRINITY_DN41291_c0_g1~~TRINITY_DN41291_c0_g1_i1.p1  ORF type:complete len:1058 (+),score=253.90 TRINITY_DN41291_c0_g1_i1:107-3280(+)
MATLDKTASGDPLDAYEEVEVLGRGAFGVATLATLKGARRPTHRVIKQVDLEKAEEAVRDEAHKEVGLLRQLQHRHIIAYYNTFVKNCTLYIIMEYADGGDLTKLIRERKQENNPFGEVEAMTIFGQCLLALAYIHRKKILHRDIKSQNIFMMKNRDAKIGDFGIAKAIEKSVETRSIIGTPSYFAPEVCNGEAYGNKVDIWAMGVVLYEMLALELPFQASNIAAIVMKIIGGEPPELEQVREEVREVVRAALRKEPDKRASAEELLKLPPVSCTLDHEAEIFANSGMDKFRKVKTLGRGQFGVADLVELLESEGEMRVVKTVDFRGLPDDAKKSAEAEVKLLRKLSHPHIIAYYDAFIEDDHLHIVLEYADAGDLAAAVAKHAKDNLFFSDEEAMAIFRQCLMALHYVHRKKVLHRDIKTKNILLMSTGEAKLGDFGISKVMDGTVAEAGTVVGTPAYLAPEICESMPYNHKIDIWSLGTVFFEILALKQPFQAENLAATVLKIIRNDPPPLPEHCGEEVRELVKLTLVKEPADRPSAKELLEQPALKRLGGSGGGGGASGQLGTTTGSSDVFSSWGGSRPIHEGQHDFEEDNDDDDDDDLFGTLQPGATSTLALKTIQQGDGATMIPGGTADLKGILEDVAMDRSNASIDYGQLKHLKQITVNQWSPTSTMPLPESADSTQMFAAMRASDDEQATISEPWAAAATLTLQGELLSQELAGGLRHGTFHESHGAQAGSSSELAGSLRDGALHEGRGARAGSSSPSFSQPAAGIGSSASSRPNSSMEASLAADSTLLGLHKQRENEALHQSDRVKESKAKNDAMAAEMAAFKWDDYPLTDDARVPSPSSSSKTRPDRRARASPEGMEASPALSPMQQRQRRKQEEADRQVEMLKQAARSAHVENAQARERRQHELRGSSHVVGSGLEHDVLQQALEQEAYLQGSSRTAPSLAAATTASAGPSPRLHMGGASAERPINRAGATLVNGGLGSSMGTVRPGSGGITSDKAGVFWQTQEGLEGSVRMASPAGHSRHLPPASPGGGTGMNDPVRIRHDVRGWG